MGRSIKNWFRKMAGWQRALLILVIGVLLIEGWVQWEVWSFERRFDPGPLQLSDVDLTLANRTDVLVNFTLTNTAEFRLYEPSVIVSMRAIPGDNDWNRTFGFEKIYPAEGPTDGTQHTEVFSETDILSPGAVYNVTRLARFEGEPLDNDIYQIHISARYENIQKEWHWSYTTCILPTGERSDAGFCGRFSPGIPYEFPRG